MTRTALSTAAFVRRVAVGALAAVACLEPAAAQTDESFVRVRITEEIASVTVKHDGEPVVIRRDQQQFNKVSEYYSYTSRPCPPFCIMPMIAAPGVETVGELELLDYLKRASEGDDTVLVVDTRKPQWPKRGMIPGAINVPWTRLDAAPDRGSVLTGHFGATTAGDGWDFSSARTLVLYCNGPWCSQSTYAIDRLLEAGYPAGKLKWYRGGMQMWENLGLTTVQGK
jgi:rhodanese-related sulfurtransferase